MFPESPASSYGSYGRWRWIQQNYVSQNRLQQTRSGVDYVLVSKVSDAKEEISEEIKRYVFFAFVFTFIIVWDLLRISSV